MLEADPSLPCDCIPWFGLSDYIIGSLKPYKRIRTEAEEIVHLYFTFNN